MAAARGTALHGGRFVTPGSLNLFASAGAGPAGGPGIAVRRSLLLFAACCLLPAAFCLLFAACCLLLAAFCLLFAACCLLPARERSADCCMHRLGHIVVR